MYVCIFITRPIKTSININIFIAYNNIKKKKKKTYLRNNQKLH